MRIKITNFGGLMPKVKPRALPEDKAQVATNLDPTSSEFRPLPNDTQMVAATGVTNPLTLYRLARVAGGAYNTDMTTGWVVRASDMNFVKGQDNADTTERTYASFNDGSAAPRVFDVTDMVTGRQLGVPKPGSAPTVVMNVVDEFTVEERATGIQAAIAQAVRAVRENSTTNYRGATHPGSTTSGYVDYTVANSFLQAADTLMFRAYALTGVGGTINNTYGAGSGDNFSWVFDPQLSPLTWITNGSTTWGGTGVNHIGIAFPAYGQTYDINSANLTTALTAILMPGKFDGTKFLTAGQITSIVTDLTNEVSPTGISVKPLIDSLATQVQELRALLDGGARTSLAAITTAFYAKTDVAAAITAAIDNFAQNVYQVAEGVARSSLPPDISPGDAGS